MRIYNTTVVAMVGGWLIATTVAAQPPSASRIAVVREFPVAVPSAQPPEVITAGPRALELAEFEAWGYGNNPAIAKAAAQVRSAQGNWLQVGLPPNPTAGYSSSEVGQDGRAGQQGAYVGQEVVTAGKLRRNRAIAIQEVRQAEQNLATARLRVQTDVRAAFYEALYAQKKVELADSLLRITSEAAKSAQSLLDAQEGSRYELLQARVEANSVRLLLETARNDHLAAWQRLSAVAGVYGMRLAPLSGSLNSGRELIQYDPTLQSLLAGSPELGFAAVSVQRARAAVARARVEPIPNLDLQAGAQHDNASGYDIANIQFSVPIPLLNRNQGGIQRAIGELNAAQGEAQRVRLDLEQRFADAYRRYANAQRRVETYAKQILPDAKQALEIVAAGYREGEFNYLAYLTAQRSFVQTNLAYLDAGRDLQQATAELDGMLLSGSLTSDRP